MTRRYGETIEVLEVRPDRRVPTAGAPAVFRWRGRTHRVVGILGFWREDAASWTGRGIEVPQRDLWRVETSTEAGICELVHDGQGWRLSRVWD